MITMRDLNTHAAQDMERADSDSMMDQRAPQRSVFLMAFIVVTKR